MRFLVDESAGPAVAGWLEEQGHDVVSVYDVMRGADDLTVLRRAHQEDRILVAVDKDFGEQIYRQQRPHAGVVLLRLRNQRARFRIQALARLLQRYANRLQSEFVVVTESRVRFAKK